MADEQNPIQRARPAAPAIPPFRGHAPAVRPALAPKAPGDGRGAPPVVAVRPAKTQAAPAADQPAGETATEVAIAAPIVAPPEPQIPALVLEPPGAEVMPPRDAPQLPAQAASSLAPEEWGSYAPPAAASGVSGLPEQDAGAQPLAGLPYFDDAGHAHGAVQSPVALPAEEADAGQHSAIALERIAARIRAGTLVVPASDASTSEAATLAAVLASMLRKQH